MVFVTHTPIIISVYFYFNNNALYAFRENGAQLAIFEKAAELDVPISWHPEFPAAQIQTHYYLSDNYPLSTGMQFATAGFGWHLDVGLHMTRLVLSGIFDKLPNLKFICGHWGEANVIQFSFCHRTARQELSIETADPWPEAQKMRA